jgi:hypothetical protein
MIISPEVESVADLAQIRHANEALGSGLCVGQGRQGKARQQAQAGQHYEEFEAVKGSFG